MNKYIFMAVAGILALSSCSNDNDEIITKNAPQQMTFTAAFGDKAQMRTTLDGTTRKVSFDAGDAISILSASNNNAKFTTTAGGASASFDGWAGTDPTYYAVYPYTDGLTLSGTTISGVKIPQNQNAAATSTCGWNPAAPIAYATTTGASLQFKNACALLKITNDRGNAVNIDVSCSNEALTGTFSLDTSSGALSSGSSTKKNAMVGNVPSGKTIYIAIAPGTKTNFRASYADGVAIEMKSKSKSSVTFEAGKIYDLGKTSEWTEAL